MPRARLVLALLLLTVTAGCYTDPKKQLDQMQESLDLSAVLNELSSRSSELEFTLDSLRSVVAKQDTAIVRLAGLAGVPYSR